MQDPRKRDFSPVVLDFGPVRFYLARHFGFCYGVENAIEISYKALEENPNKNVYLLSQMIHNQEVNGDLEDRGIRFIMDTEGNSLMDWDEVTADDVVIIPAFGTTVEIEKQLRSKGIQTEQYNTTCPFVEKVWNRAEKLGGQDHTVIIHGKSEHEETRATFSHSDRHAASIIIRNMEEAKLLAGIIRGERDLNEFYELFSGKYSEGFDAEKDLQKIGVVNQTTMLATETQAIADYLKRVMKEHYPDDPEVEHFADTRDTLCYATNDNQDATYQLMKTKVDLAFVVGGYNSSNTSHIVELLESKFPTYFIKSEEELLSSKEVQHFNLHSQQAGTSTDYIPENTPLNVAITSGASCPDTLIDRVMMKFLSFFDEVKPVEEVLSEITQ